MGFEYTFDSNIVLALTSSASTCFFFPDSCTEFTLISSASKAAVSLVKRASAKTVSFCMQEASVTERALWAEDILGEGRALI